MPAYSDYTNREKMSEVILVGSTCRTEVTEIVQTGSALPVLTGSVADIGCAKSGGVLKYVTSVAVSTSGVISVLVPEILEAGTVTLTPYDSTPTAITFAGATGWSGEIAEWRYASDDAELSALLPSSCKS